MDGNPLAGVLAAVRLLRKTGLDASQQQLVDTLDDSGQSLLSLLDGTLAQVAAPTSPAAIPLMQTKASKSLGFAPGELLRGLLAVYEAQAMEKGILLCMQVDPALPGLLSGDVVALRQILLNLLCNAIKFTPSGIVKLTATAKAGTTNRMVFSVMDSGIGIPADQLARIFLPYTQAHGIAGQFTGTGLGLSLCRQLADSMGGSLTVSSEPDRGSTFSLDLPLDIAIPDSARVVYARNNSDSARCASGPH